MHHTYRDAQIVAFISSLSSSFRPQNIHSEMYSRLIDTYIKDKAEK